jgi:hypothetical protein
VLAVGIRYTQASTSKLMYTLRALCQTVVIHSQELLSLLMLLLLMLLLYGEVSDVSHSSSANMMMLCRLHCHSHSHHCDNSTACSTRYHHIIIAIAAAIACYQFLLHTTSFAPVAHYIAHIQPEIGCSSKHYYYYCSLFLCCCCCYHYSYHWRCH